MNALDWNTVLHLARTGNAQAPQRIERSDREWRELLSEEEFQVCRLKGTERPHSSEMCRRFEPGRYACRCCGTELFDASAKFDSGTGWPSFTEPVRDDVVAYVEDRSYAMVRIETVCNVCDAHLGHVFPDGPAPSGLRFCINAVSLSRLSEK